MQSGKFWLPGLTRVWTQLSRHLMAKSNRVFKASFVGDLESGLQS